MIASLLQTEVAGTTASTGFTLFAALLLLVVLVISPVSGAARECAN